MLGDASRPEVHLAGELASRRTAVHGGQAFFAYATNDLIDLKHAVILAVEATQARHVASDLSGRARIFPQ